MKIFKRILLILIIYLFSIIYTYSFKYYINNINNNNNISHTSEKGDYDATNHKSILKFINDYELYSFDYFDSCFSNPSKLSNEIKIKVAYKMISKHADFNKGVSSSKFLIYLKSIFGNGISIKNQSTQIYKDDDNSLMLYDKDNDIYVFKNEYKDDNFIELLYSYDYYYKQSNHIYELRQYKFFAKHIDDNICNIYPSYGYAKNDINVLFTLENCNENYMNEINNYIKNNKKNLKNTMISYKYTFEKNKNILYFKKYERN